MTTAIPTLNMDTGQTLIINYHYCVSQWENPYLALTAVSPEMFEVHMATLVEYKNLFRKEFDMSVLITFDDGTRDVWQNAVPIIQRYGIPAILFCCSMPLIEKRVLNVTKIHLLQAKLGLPRFRVRFMGVLKAIAEPYELDNPERIGLGQMYRYDDEETRQFKFLLNTRLPYAIVTRLLDELFEAEFGSQAEAVESLYMSVDELKRARDAGIAIGLHTHRHFMLGRLSSTEQELEILSGLRFFRSVLGSDHFELSYPYGIPGSWNSETKSILTHNGITRAYTMGRQIYNPIRHTDSLEVPRFDVNDVFDKTGTLRLDVLK